MLLVVQGTPFCNLDCSYCYLPDRDNKARIRLETVGELVRAIARMRRPPNPLSVVWHAGEPLVLPVGFYQTAFDLFDQLADLGISVTQGFQTNGVLIDEPWLRFFEQRRPSIGVSIDGPQAIHDAHRTYRGGAPSWARCMRGIRRLQAADIPFHTISVLTLEALRQPRAMFDFFVEARCRDIAFNVEELDGANTASGITSAEYEQAFAAFLRAFIQFNAAAGYPLRIREAEGAAMAVLDDGIPYNTQVEAGRILSVDVDGRVSTFSPELLGLKSAAFEDFVIGDVASGDLDAMLRSPVAVALGEEIALGVERCRQSCELFRFCKGGAPANKLGETGSFRSAETRFCKLTVKTTIQLCVDLIYDLMANPEAGGAPAARSGAASQAAASPQTG
jgi:uncharacterized protein